MTAKSISDLEKKYKDEWLAIEVTKKDEQGKSLRGELITHSKDKDEVLDKVQLKKGKDVLIIFSGPILKEGYVAMFGCMDVNQSAAVISLDMRLSGTNGSCSIKAALDTGASFTIIPWRIARLLGHEPMRSENRVNIITASGTETIPLVTLDAIEVLDIKKENLVVGCHDMPPQSRINALLGLNFLKQLVTTIDLKANKLTIEN